MECLVDRNKVEIPLGGSVWAFENRCRKCFFDPPEKDEGSCVWCGCTSEDRPCNIARPTVNDERDDVALATEMMERATIEDKRVSESCPLCP